MPRISAVGIPVDSELTGLELYPSFGYTSPVPQFSYKARRRTGELVEGSIDGADRPAVLMQIERLGLFPVAVQAARGAVAKSGDKPSGGPAGALVPSTVRDFFNRQRKPRLDELAMWTQQLANLLRAGMPLTLALNSMSSLGSKGIPGAASQLLKQDVMEGKSLSDAMTRQPGVFPDIVVNIVRAGEQSGALEEVLRRQASHFERFAEVQSRFKSALVYPAVVFSVGVMLVVFFMTFMLPKFMALFEGMNVPLPGSTQMLIRISRFTGTYWWLFPLVAVMGYVLFTRYRATPSGRRKLDHFQMRVPIFGKIVRLNLFGQFSRTLATLLQNGVPVLNALKITEQIVPNVIVREAISKTREAVTDGKTLAQPLAHSGIFPQLMIDLLKIGEETGNVPESLNNVADTYERDLNMALRAMTNLIEPVLIIGIAIVVGFLLLSVMSAMFAITNSIQR